MPEFNHKFFLFGMICLISGFLIARQFGSQNISRENDLIERGWGGRFTNPLLACGDIDNLSVGSMEKLKKKIENIVESRVNSKGISHISAYVRDLNNGPWLGINEKEFFYPASLLKVPLLLASYKAEEDNPGFLDQVVRFDKPLLPTIQLFLPAENIQIGKTYTLKELLRRSIVYSDNEATALLAVYVGQKYALNVFADFGIEKPKENEDYQMRVRTYASFFRVLYNASYLSRKHSEEALSILSQVDFPDGLQKGVPGNIPITHKFGEREGGIDNGDYQLHDCGIVYTENPYLICVMAQGKSTDAMLDVIAEISKTVYDSIGK